MPLLSTAIFRSVAFRYFHPDDVISGEGTRLSGGRFVPVGVRAVYASLEEGSGSFGPAISPQPSFQSGAPVPTLLAKSQKVSLRAKPH